jgi:predicted nucleic acid-binding protein
VTGLKVRAKVVDVRADDPSADDQIWVDTQVWLVLAYSRMPCPTHLREYPRYIKRATQRQATLVAGTIHLAELARCVEHSERQIYEAQQSLPQMNIKTFRKIAPARVETVAQIASAWRMLTSMASLSVEAVNSGDIETTIQGLESDELLDPGDALQLAEARRRGMNLILSDDSDFATVKGITLLTANERTLRAAADQRCTIRRHS